MIPILQMKKLEHKKVRNGLIYGRATAGIHRWSIYRADKNVFFFPYLYQKLTLKTKRGKDQDMFRTCIIIEIQV